MRLDLIHIPVTAVTAQAATFFAALAAALPVATSGTVVEPSTTGYAVSAAIGAFLAAGFTMRPFLTSENRKEVENAAKLAVFSFAVGLGVALTWTPHIHDLFHDHVVSMIGRHVDLNLWAGLIAATAEKFIDAAFNFSKWKELFAAFVKRAFKL